MLTALLETKIVFVIYKKGGVESRFYDNNTSQVAMHKLPSFEETICSGPLAVKVRFENENSVPALEKGPSQVS